MKPSTLFIAASMSLLISCGNKTEKPALAGDTIASEIQGMVPDKTETTAPDVRMHDLLGNVKSLKLYYDETNTEWCFHITFSQQGEWLTTNGDTPIKEFFNKTLQRDAEGRITALRHEVEATCEIEDDTYTYNDQGLLATARFADDMGTNTETYTYDTDGNLTQMVSHSMDAEEGESTTTTRYRILETDSHGNWTRREATDTNGGKYISKRVIEYWQ